MIAALRLLAVAVELAELVGRLAGVPAPVCGAGACVLVGWLAVGRRNGEG